MEARGRVGGRRAREYAPFGGGGMEMAGEEYGGEGIEVEAFRLEKARMLYASHGGNNKGKNMTNFFLQ